ncbi:LOW QUALITY PROTEIN: F-box/FBD/LRR-repeat protein At3g52680-like [Lycium ferocissimum]|uniref:LOW QUALITY PROTEIN: F-box/FBD/LRR-repeat protein At3g52680-like n=1 Tax=Lycium ferocissimum TaxID=112874 RepID=UPI0028166B68|nr:LOW QUALITY PROTEIN: F-box/FBD/LRR-repeat protein At3g52680-like [Lycium ferocissimum]
MDCLLLLGVVEIQFSSAQSGTGYFFSVISSLPDDILHSILSSLFIFDVVQLSVLSKRWKYIWTTMPYLHFDLDRFYLERVNRPCDIAMVEKFKEFINWVLISQRATKLVRFLLCCSNIFDKVAILRWIHATTRRNVQEVVLHFSLGEPFELPYCLVTCESLQVLKLHLCGDILKLPNHFGFRQLKLLHLEEVDLSDEHLTSCLFSKCYHLETLILEECSLGAMKLLDIASASLIYLTLANVNYNMESYDNCEVKISCPNLKFLKYQAPMPKDIIVENLFSIEVVHFCIYDSNGSREETGILVRKMIKEVPSTSILKLYKTAIWGLYEAARKERLSPLSFYKLKSLKLFVDVDEDFMQVMILLLKYAPNLEVLKLWSDENGDWTENWQMHDPDESIVCLDSHLKSIQLIGFKEDENEIELVRFFLKNAQVLEKLTIVWAPSYAKKSEEASEEISIFPRTSSHVVVTFLDAKPWPKPRTGKWYSSYEK